MTERSELVAYVLRWCGKHSITAGFVLLLAATLVPTVAASDGATPQVLPGQSLTLLPSGQILLAGGYVKPGVPTATLAISYGPDNIQPLAVSMQSARAGHTATVLPDGHVLIFGGYGTGGKLVSTAEMFDPASGQISPVSGFRVLPRAFHTATVLTDGTLLVIGGIGEGKELANNVQTWDYRTGNTLAYSAALSVPRQQQTATLLPNGNVQVSGGRDHFGKPTQVSEQYDITSHNFSVFASDTSTLVAPSVADSIPMNGSTDVLITDIVGVRFESAMSVLTLNTGHVTLEDSVGNRVTATVTGAETGRLVFVIPASPLKFGTTYLLTLDGLLDSRGQTLPTKTIQFTTQSDSQDSIDESWIPGPDAFNGRWSTGTGPSIWQKLPPLQAPPGVTAVSGQVLRINGRPLAHVLLIVDGQRAYSDSTGRFLVTNMHGGYHAMVIDGRTANRRGVEYGLYLAGIKVKAGITNVLKYTIWMTKLDMAHAVNIPSPTTAEDTVVTSPLLPGLELHLPKDTVITSYDGHPVRQLSITPIPLDKPPFPLPPGVEVQIYFTIQPGGAFIQVPGGRNVGARLIYPNSFHNQPGTAFDFWNYDPHKKGWYVYGEGHVDKSGRSVVPDPGVYVYELTGAMVGNSGGPFPHGPLPNPSDGDPVRLSTGLFVYDKTDLILPDVIPLVLKRTYRVNDNVSHSFGIGTTDSYDIYMTGDTNPYTFQELILPDGYRVRFDRISAGTGYSDAVYLHSEAQDEYYGATLTFNQSNPYNAAWLIKKKDGTQLWFPISDSDPNPRHATPVAIVDRYGNTLRFQRDSNSNLLKITSPNGRYISFTYDASNRITQATDNSGRSVNYAYDTDGRLHTVEDAAGGTTTFTYDDDNEMLTIQDARGIVYLTNQYNSAGRVTQQTLANDGTYLFDWTLQNTGELFAAGGSTAPVYQGGSVMGFRNCSDCYEGYTPLMGQVDITDPRGYVRRIIFDTQGRVSTDTHALGQPEEQTYTYDYYADNTLKTVINPLQHQTKYTYDGNLNLVQLDQLAETSSPVTSYFSFDSTYNQLASVTDPLGHTTSFSIDTNGNTVQISDPLSHNTAVSYNPDGTPATVTDAQSNTVAFGYSGGDLTSILDPQGNQTTRFTDAAGRLLSVTAPAGHRTKYQYNDLNQVTQITDPVGNGTSFAYDANGNLQTVTDALNHTTTYSYNNMDQVETRTDPLNRQESYLYDLNGNLSSFTDRKGQVTSYAYDGLNRVTMVGFGANNNQYDSTINYQYDAGNRMTQAVDSISGTITRSYDGLNRLTGETTPQGSISYGYDNAGRRTSMQVAGQTEVDYSYDNANRLTEIAQGSSTVNFTYDSANRRSTLTLPNGIVAGYTYDQDSHLTAITYTLSSNSVGDLGYGYDVLGQRTTVSGSFAATGFPAAVSSATYDAANELTNWGGVSISYDANGNTVGDSVHTYSWDARNQLSTIDSASTGAFGYDAFGRRFSKSILGASATTFFYDRANPIQELSGTTPIANLLVGGIDEYFTRTDSVGTVNFLTDALGSSLALTGSTGAIQSQYGYDPFGNTTASGAISANAFLYTGRENDGSNLYFLRARYYNPAIGRFISEDPKKLAAGINFYSYVWNDPVGHLDPFGLDKKRAKCASSPSPGPTDPWGALDSNVHEAMETSANEDLSYSLPLFVMNSWNGGSWDPKSFYYDHSTNDAFGNYQWGAMCNAYGYSQWQCQGGAGIAQIATDLQSAYRNGRWPQFTGQGMWPFIAPYSDRANDSDLVRRGWEYAEWKRDCSTQ